MARRLAAVAIAVLGAAIGGCGEAGVEGGATLSVYVSQPLCAEARQALVDARSRAGDFRLRAVCVDDAGTSGEARLAAIGAAARRATEDSTTVAYLGVADRIAARFATPILEGADVPRISARAGKPAAARLIAALRRADDSGSLREAVAEEIRR